MQTYEKLYYHIFNRCTDIIEELKLIQQEVEEMYLQSTEGEDARENFRLLTNRAFEPRNDGQTKII